MKVFNADQARELANEVNLKEYREIIEKIREEASSGHTYLTWYNGIEMDCTISALEDSGFKVVKSDDDTVDVGYIIEIKW